MDQPSDQKGSKFKSLFNVLIDSGVAEGAVVMVELAPDYTCGGARRFDLARWVREHGLIVTYRADETARPPISWQINEAPCYTGFVAPWPGAPKAKRKKSK